MPRIAPITGSDAPPRSVDLLEAIYKRHGTTPNLTRTLARSEAALAAWARFDEALDTGCLGPRIRASIALAVADASRSPYCLATYAALGRSLGMSGTDIAMARLGVAPDPRADAALKLALSVLFHRGAVSDDDLQRAREAGLPDGEILEVVANVAFALFSDWTYRLAQPHLDFPPVYPQPQG